MGTTLTGKRVQNTYDSLLKIGDNDNLTGTAKRIGDGLGNDSPIFLSTTKIGIGVTPTYEFQTNSHAKIGGNLIVGGNLTVNGTTTIIDSTVIAIGDNMMEMAKDNVSNTMDIGWYGTINESGEKYVGVFYDASTGVTTPEFHIGLGTVEPSSTASWTTKGKLVIGALDATTGVFSGQVTIPQTPSADTDAASKGYVDSAISSGSVEVAKRIEITVKNISGGSLSKGTIVHASPSVSPPSGNVVEVIAADYDDATKMPGIGVLNETIANEAEGAAVMLGAVSGIDTSSFSAGDELFVGNNGAFTNTKPTANNELIQKIAIVLKVHASNGSIKVFGAGRVNDVPNQINRNVNFTDNSKLTFGDSTTPDFQIYHDGNNSYINEDGTGVLAIQSNGTEVQINKGASEYMARFITDGAVNLYYDNSKKFETTSTGISITGLGQFSNKILVADGSVSAPSYSFTNDTDSGIYHSGTQLKFALGGSDKITISSGETTIEETLFVNDYISADDKVIIEGENAYLQIQDVSQETYTNLYSLDAESVLSYTHGAFSLRTGFFNGTVVFSVDSSRNVTFNNNVLPDVDSANDLGSTSLRWANVWADNINGGTPVNGSGTANDVVMWSDSDTLTDAPIAISGNNATFAGSVGIGTSSPDSKLHVDSGVSSTSDWGNLGIISDFPINNAGRIYTSYLLQDSESIKGAGIGLAYDGTGYKMHFGTASTTSSGLSTQMTIDRLGNLGIGTTSPDAKLDILGASSDQLRLRTAETEEYKIGRNSSTGLLEFYGTQSGYTGYVFGGVNGTRMTIDSSGNSTFAGSVTANTGSKITSSSADTTFSIETTSGTTIFPVLDFVSSHSSAGARIRVSGTDVISIDKSQNLTFAGTIAVGGATPTTNAIEINGADGTSYVFFKSAVATTGARVGLNGDDLRVFNQQAAGELHLGTNGATKLTINSSGNVGISTTSPAQKLHIASGHIRIDSGYALLWDDSHERIEQSDGHLEFFINNGQAMTLNTNGLGIGTTSPSTKLHISGGDPSIRLTPSGSNDARVDFTDSGGTVRWYTGYDVSSGNLVIASDEGGFGSSNIMVMNDSGNVGIGAAPANKLHIQQAKSGSSAENYDLLRFNLTGTGAIGDSSSIVWYSTSGTKTAGIEGISGQDNILYGELAFNVRKYTTDSFDEVMRINNRGNVGIGTDSPAQKLEVIGNVSLGLSSTTTRTALLANTFGYSTSWKTLTIGSTGTNYQTDAVSLCFNVMLNQNSSGSYTGDGSELFFRNVAYFKTPNSSNNGYLNPLTFNNGNIGISTTSPSYKLQVNGTAYINETLYVNGATTIDDNLYVTNGNVGIGTTSPAEILQTNKNSAGNIVGGYFTNSQANTGAESVSLAFGLNRSGGDFVRQVKAITFGAEQQWTGTPSTVDGYLAFSTVSNETVSEKMRITSGGQIVFQKTDNTTLPAGSINHASNDFLYVTGGTGGASFGDDNHNTRMIVFDNNYVRFDTAGTERLRITSGGYTEIKASGGSSRLYLEGASGTHFLTGTSGGDFGIYNDTANSYRMFINSSGDILFGTTTKGNDFAYFEAADNNRRILHLGSSSTGAETVVLFRNPNGAVGSVITDGFTTSFGSSSDYRLKENVVEMTDALDRVSNLKPSRFNFIGEEKTVDGFLAHEVQDIVPEAISGKKDAVDEKGNPIYQGIDQSKLVPLLVGAIQELKDEIEILRSQINS